MTLVDRVMISMGRIVLSDKSRKDYWEKEFISNLKELSKDTPSLAEIYRERYSIVRSFIK